MSDTRPDSVRELARLLNADIGPLVEPFADRTAVADALAENAQRFEGALRELRAYGASPEEALRSMILQMESVLAGTGDLRTLEAVKKAHEHLLAKFSAPEGLHLTETAAMRLLEAHPPENFMRATGSATLAELYTRYAPREALALTRHTEDRAWQERYHALLKDVTERDFERRAIMAIAVDSEREGQVLWNTHGPLKPWRVSHSKEVGAVISFTRPEAESAVTPKLLHALVFAHYMEEASFAGRFFEVAAQETPKTLGQRVALVITSAEDKFPFFYPNLYSENLFWSRALALFAESFPVPHLPFFLSTLACGGNCADGRPLSLNLIDHVWDLNLSGTKSAQAYFNGEGSTFFYHFREARWSDTFRRLLGLPQAEFDRQIMRLLDAGDRSFTQTETGLYARARWQEHLARLAKRTALSLLRKSERYAKTDMVYLASNGGWLGVGHIISALSGFALTLVLANAVPKDVYGTYNFLLSIAGILSAFVLPGMLTAMIVAAAKGRGRDLRAAYRSRLRFGFVGSVAALIGALYYYLAGNMLVTSGMLIIALCMPFFEASTIYQGYWNGLRRFATLTTADSIVRIGGVAILIITAFLFPNPLALLAAYFIGYAILRFLAYRKAQSEAGEATTAYEARSTLAFGRHLSVMSALGLVANYLDKIMLFHILGPADVAAYTVALSLPEQVRTVFRNLSLVVLPKIAKDAQVPKLPQLAFRMFQLALLGLVILVFYALLAPFAFALLFPSYASAAGYSTGAAIALVVLATMSVFSTTTLRAHEATRELYIHTIAVSLVRIVLVLTLIPRFGIWGAVIALIAHQAAVLVSSTILLYLRPKA